MPSESTLTLFIPDLFGFQSILSQLSKDELSQLPETRFPILEKWLSRGYVEKSSHDHDVIFSEFQLSQTQKNDIPFAALSLQGESGFNLNNSDSNNFNTEPYWLRADPVFLQPDRDSAILAAHEELELTQDEANKLVDAINTHFVDEPWQLHALHHHRWYLKLDSPQQLSTHPLANVLGDNINEFMPMGNDAKYWFKITNEIQMLLHGTNVNFERESRNMLTANSIWLWGGGCLPEKSNMDCSYNKIVSNDVYHMGIANYVDIDVIPLNGHLENNLLESQSFVVLDMLSDHVQHRDVYSYMQTLNEIEESFLKKYQALLTEGEIKEIRLISNDGVLMTITSKLLRRWWKRIKPFSNFKL